MSKPRARWWGYVKLVVRDYPAMRRRYAHSPASLPPQDRREFEAVECAIRTCRDTEQGRERLRLIETYLRSETDGLRGAAVKENISYATAKRRYGSFLRMVAEWLLGVGDDG